MTALDRYNATLTHMRSAYAELPHTIAVETLAACNARCTFCAYGELERKGTRMPDDVIDRLIEELREFPADHVFHVNLCGTSEPLVDPRFLSICGRIGRSVPGARLLFYTNGSLLTPELLQRVLDAIPIAMISVSLNEIDGERYRSLMGLDFQQTLRNLDHLHQLHASRPLPFSVRLSRVSHDDTDTGRFVEFCRRRYPRFRTKSRTQRGHGPREHAMKLRETGCTQWFKLHLLADGSEALCCLDSEAQHGLGHRFPDATLLQLYSSAHRRRLRTRSTRADHEYCNGCDRLL